MIALKWSLIIGLYWNENYNYILILINIEYDLYNNGTKLIFHFKLNTKSFILSRKKYKIVKSTFIIVDACITIST